MKAIQFIFCLMILVVFVNAQKKVEHMPKPVGGVEAIMKNVLYPKEAKEQKIQGKVLVKAVIDEEGNVEEVSVVKGVNELLEKAAMNAIQNTKFTPGMDKGKAVKAEVTIPIKFKLDNCKKKKETKKS